MINKKEIIRRLQRKEPGLIVDIKTCEVYQVNNSEVGRGFDDIFLCRLRRKEIPYRRELEERAREIEEGILRLEQENERILQVRGSRAGLLPAQGEHHYVMWNSIFNRSGRYE